MSTISVSVYDPAAATWRDLTTNLPGNRAYIDTGGGGDGGLPVRGPYLQGGRVGHKEADEVLHQLHGGVQAVHDEGAQELR